ncbi:hypothetical protein BU17DRAFT_64389 [Hysterangium stoloniferum]|nr:hypothetical protein BU17DRAFT_64389 [Hysterangium stoloniferum]
MCTKVSSLEAQLDAQRDLVATLKLMLQTQPAAASTQAKTSGKLTIPPSPANSSRVEFPDVKFWTRSDWQQFTKDCIERGRDFKKLGFLTNEEGQALGDTRISVMTDYAKQLWNSLRTEKEDPESWGGRNAFASEYFCNHMCTKFPEFQWCEGDWKVQAFATVGYPDWVGQARKSVSSSKRHTDNDEDPSSSHRKKKSKNQGASVALPPCTDTIDLASDEPSNSSALQTSSLSPPFIDRNYNSLATAGSTNSNSKTPSQTLDLPFPIPCPITPQLASAPTQPGDLTSSEMPVHRTPDASNVPVYFAISVDLNQVQELTPQDECGTTITPTANNLLAQQEDELLDVFSTPIYMNLTIPAPSNEIPYGPTLSTPTASKRTESKKGKVMEPSKAITAHNLYALNYLKEHPDTSTAEFKKVFNNLDKETRKYVIF